jgi:hypothetical protein
MIHSLLGILFVAWMRLVIEFPYYTALGHTPALAGCARELRFFRKWEAQFVTVGIIYHYHPFLMNRPPRHSSAA